MHMSPIKINGFQHHSGSGDYCTWVDSVNLSHQTELNLVLEQCKNGQYGLSSKDADAFQQAHDRWVLERELGPLNFEGRVHHVGERMDR